MMILSKLTITIPQIIKQTLHNYFVRIILFLQHFETIQKANILYCGLGNYGNQS